MSWNGLGTYVLPPAFSPEVNGTTIDATRYNGLTSDVANGITQTLNKNGENVPTANISWGGFKLTNLAQAGVAGDALGWGQNASVVNLTVTGTSTFTGVINAPLGAVGAPSYTFTGDTDTGMWSQGANVLNWSTGGSQRMALSSSGLNVTSAAAGQTYSSLVTNSDNTNAASHARYTASVGGAAAGDPSIIFDISGVLDWAVGVDNSDSDAFKISASGSLGTIDRFIIDSSGNVGIGKFPGVRLDIGALTDTANSLQVNVSNAGVSRLVANSSGGGALLAITNHSGATDNGIPSSTSGIATITDTLVFAPNGVERARLTTAGNLLVGRTADSGGNKFLQIGSNSIAARAEFASNDSFAVLVTGGSGQFIMGASNAASPDMVFSNNAASERFRITNNNGANTWDGGAMQEVGFRDVPRITAYSNARGKCVALTAGITVNTGDASAGAVVSVYNDSAASITITQGAGMTLRLGGTATTGNRTLAARGLMTIWWNASTEAVCSGAGVT